MPGQYLPADPAKTLADINTRLTRLETYPDGTILLGQATGVGGYSGGAYYSGPGYQWVSGATIPQIQFTIIRPIPILVLAEIGGFGGSGGTASYTLVRCAIMSSSTASIGANDITGVEMRSAAQWQTQGSGLANGAAVMCYTPPPGTYWVGWGFAMQGGSLTTFGVQSNRISVFSLQG